MAPFVGLLIPIVVGLPVTFAILLAVSFFVGRKRKKLTEKLDEMNYEMRRPRFDFWIGVIGTAFTFSIIVILIITKYKNYGSIESGVLVILSILGLFMLSGIFLAVYSIQWKIIVKKNALIIKMPFRHIMEIDINDITIVKQNNNEIIGYINGKRIFSIDNTVLGFDLFRTQLNNAGKIEFKKDNFAIKGNKKNIAFRIFSLIFAVGCLIGSILWPNDTANWFVYTLFSGFTIFSLYFLIPSIKCKLAVKDDEIIIKTLIRKEKSYKIKTLSKLNFKTFDIEIFTDGKIIATFAMDNDNVSFLLERLKCEGIPFYRRGKLLE